VSEPITDPEWGRRVVKVLNGDEPTQVLNAIKRALNGRVGWDLPPEWGHIYRAENGRFRCRPIPVPDSMWNAGNGDPKNVLASYREFLTAPRGPHQRAAADAIRAHIPDSLVGMYMVTEGWAPPAHKVRAMYEASERGERTPAYKDLPDRVEIRAGGAVDLDGRMYHASQPRPTMVLDGFVDDLTPGKMVGGQIPELLLGILFSIAKDRTART